MEVKGIFELIEAAEHSAVIVRRKDSDGSLVLLRGNRFREDAAMIGTYIFYSGDMDVEKSAVAAILAGEHLEVEEE